MKKRKSDKMEKNENRREGERERERERERARKTYLLLTAGGCDRESRGERKREIGEREKERVGGSRLLM